jgi:polyvinyl alcohol dehydrogenase (cytochrome)
MVALDANTGKVLWQTYTVPDNGGKVGGYSGGAIWQPPAIDYHQKPDLCGHGEQLHGSG